MEENYGTTIVDVSNHINNGTIHGATWLSNQTPENTISLWDDIDDFNNYSLSSVPEYPNFSCFVTVNYVDASTNFHTYTSSITNYKSVMVKIEHPSISALIDTMIISSGF